MDTGLQELLYDFDVKHSRVVATDKYALLDNVSRVVMISDSSITVENGKMFAAIIGRDFVIKEIEDGRMLIKGEIERVEFYKSLGKDQD